jgi:hypothetical protein
MRLRYFNKVGAPLHMLQDTLMREGGVWTVETKRAAYQRPNASQEKTSLCLATTTNLIFAELAKEKERTGLRFTTSV